MRTILRSIHVQHRERKDFGLSCIWQSSACFCTLSNHGPTERIGLSLPCFAANRRVQWLDFQLCSFYFPVMENIVSVVLLTTAVCAGCQSHSTSARLQSITKDVLFEHQFTPPVFMARRDAMISAVASRPLSDAAVETVCMNLQRNRRASVEITSYQYVGSDWARVGKLFDHGRGQREAAEIEQSLENRLKTR
jgi:hypothetical protein